MAIYRFVAVLIFVSAAASQAAQMPAMPVGLILEERRNDDDLSLVVPDRLELYCELGTAAEKGHCFAGFETRWRGPIEFEVSGSGTYEQRGQFSAVAISLDYGGKDGWIERSLFGLGLIPDSRISHCPAWGVGSDGKSVTRGNLGTAKPEPQRLVIDPARYAPPGWDGRLWIGLVDHEVGKSVFIRARVVNALPPDGKIGPERDRAAMSSLLREHQRAFLLSRQTGPARVSVASAKIAAEMVPYAKAMEAEINDSSVPRKMERAVSEMTDKPMGAEEFAGLVSARHSWLRGLEEMRKRASAAPALLNGFLRSWQESGGFGSEIGCMVRTVSNLEKVEITDFATGSIVRRNPEPIRVSAARREHEGFQLVLSPLPACGRQISVSVTELKSSGGTIPSSCAKVNPIGYVRITPFDGKEIIVPDPLLIGAIPDLAPGENQPVWISIRVPDNAPAGEYHGSVVIRAEGAESLRIPLVLTVRDFDIPKKITLRSSFWLFRDQLNRFYHLDEIALDDYLKWVNFTEYRLCPVDVYEGKCKSLLDVAGPGNVPNLNPDFTAWDRFVDRMVAGGASTIHLGQSHHQGGWFADKDNPVSSPGQIARVVENLKVLREHYIRRGVYDLHYMQLRDETSEPASLNVYRGVREQLPDVKLLLTVPSEEARPLLQIPCPLTPGFNSEWRDEVKAKGGEYWWYVCLGPRDPYANFMTYQTATQHRALFWQTWKNEVEGLLYWGLNFWAWYGYEWPATATMPIRRLPLADAPRYDNNPRWPGDGVLMYPGPSPSEPMSCIRLEILRDGEEDFEYLTLLDKLITEAEKRGDTGPALREARAARAAARRLVPDLTNHEKTPHPYLRVRERVAEAIEGLLH